MHKNIDEKIKTKGRILIVDDEPYLLEALFDVLEQEGFNITTCKTPIEAENLIRSVDFQVALLDIKMPGIDGLTLAGQLKERDPNLAILILTAYPNQETAIKALRLKVADYLIKPVNVEELIKAIDNALNIREKNKDVESIKTQLLKQKEELDKTREILIKSNKFSSLGQISMEIFHEIKNMLAIMNVSIYFLNKNIKNLDSKLEKHIEIIKKQISHSNQIIMSLLDFSRKKEEKIEELNVNQILEDILLIIEPELKLKSIKLVKSFTSEKHLIQSNSNKLKQVFLNFILNAKDAMPEGGQLRINTFTKNDTIFIEFSDTGLGVPEENKEKIFEPFFSTKKENEGVGLGLAVSKEMIQELNGDVYIQSKKEKGTDFIIKLPLSK